KIEQVTINGKDFYKLTILCPGRINCDKKGGSRQKVKIKLKNGLKFNSADLSYNCPLVNNKGKIRKKKHVVVFPYICPTEEPIINIKAFNRNKDTLIISKRLLNDFTRKRKLSSSCVCQNKSKEKFLGIFRIRSKYLYKKYKIY